MAKHKDIHAFRAEFRDRVHADHDLSYAAQAVGYHFGYYMTLPDSRAKYETNGGKVYVWCSQEDLAARSGVHVSRVSTCVQQLIDRGHLRRVKRGNNVKRRSNKYRIVLKDADDED